MSFKTNANTPKPISSNKITARNNEYDANRHVFSRRAPRAPLNPITNVTKPKMIRTNAGSNATFVNFEKLLKISFSVHAHIPTPKMKSPKSYKEKSTSVIGKFIRRSHDLPRIKHLH